MAMTEDTRPSAADVIDFETAMEAVIQAHRRHLAAVSGDDAADARRSRRGLYDALKDYRRKETNLYRTKVGAAQMAEEDGEPGPA